MIKYSEIEKIFKKNNIDAIEYNYETNEEIETPFVVYMMVDSNSFVADGINYIELLNIRMALIDGELNTESNSLIEKTFYENCIKYEKSVDFDNDNRLYSTLYTFEVLSG